MNPLFSIIIPTYNSEKTIEKCLKSISNSVFTNYEVIVVNDGSSDNTSNLVSNIGIPQVTLYNKSNEGPGKSRNFGISKSKGYYIVFIDSDDYVDPYFLDELYKVCIAESPDVLFIDTVNENVDGKKISNLKFNKYRYMQKSDLVKLHMTCTIPWGAVRRVIKSDLIYKHSIFFQDTEVGEEAIFAFKSLFYANKLSYMSNSKYHYVQHRDSQSAKGGTNPWFKMTIKMKQELISIGAFAEYKDAYYGLVYKSLIIETFRIMCISGIKKGLNKYRKEKLNLSEITSQKKTIKYLNMRYKVLFTTSRLKLNVLVYLFLISIFLIRGGKKC